MNAYAYRQIQRGFTVVELMTVIVVMGILAGIVYVNGTGYIERAAQSSAKGDLTSAASKLQVMYNKDGIYPAPTGTNTLPTSVEVKITDSSASFDKYFTSTDQTKFCLFLKNTRFASASAYVGSKATIPVAASQCPTDENLW
jgi:prepilin-type N-terminal cleavage/methylation domain-containing protein